MKLLIATPMYGGMNFYKYLLSYSETQDYLRDHKIDYQLHIQHNESLISRARNRAAQYAVDNGFTDLFFIDADMVWTWEQIDMILKSDKDIVGGTYPFKAFPVTPNFNPLTEHCHIFENNVGSKRSAGDYFKYAETYADKLTGEVEVKHLPTGFMKIKTHVLKAMQPHCATYHNMYTISGHSEQNWDYFPVRVKDNILESEDWAFCSNARDLGFKVYLNTKVITGHVGTIEFRIT